MSESRYVRAEVWSDEWVMDLDPSEKLLWIFLLTNERANIAGIYKALPKWVAFHIGLDTDMTQKILDRFDKDGKISQIKGYIIITNHVKHQVFKNPSVEKGIVRIINDLPLEIRDFVTSSQSVYRLSTRCCTLLNLTLPNSTLPNPTDTDRPEGDQVETQEVKVYQEPQKIKNPINEFIALFENVDPLNYDASFKKKTERQASEKLIKYGEAQGIDWQAVIPSLPTVYRLAYFPSGLVSNKPTELLRNWEKIKTHVDKFKATQQDKSKGKKKKGSVNLSKK